MTFYHSEQLKKKEMNSTRLFLLAKFELYINSGLKGLNELFRHFISVYLSVVVLLVFILFFFCRFIFWDCTYLSIKRWTEGCLSLLGKMNSFIGFDWHAEPDIWQFILAFICPHQYEVPWDCVSCPVNHRVGKQNTARKLVQIRWADECWKTWLI